MSEGAPKGISLSSIEARRNTEILTLARELFESKEIFPFSGLESESYAKLKAVDEKHPGYSTPIDELLLRFEKEGMKVVLGKDPMSGNIFILPGESNDIENDMVPPKHFRTDTITNASLRKMIELSK